MNITTIAAETAEQKATWFVYDPNDSFETFDSREKALSAAIDAFSQYEAEAADDGWPEEVTQLCWGMVIGEVVEISRRKRPPESELDENECDKEGVSWRHFDEMIGYKLEERALTAATAEAQARIADLERQRADDAETFAVIAGERDHLKQHATDLERQLAEAKERNEWLGKQIDSHIEAVDTHENIAQERDQLREQLAEVNVERDRLIPECATLRNERNRLVDKLTQVTRERDEYQAKYNREGQGAANARSMVDALRADLAAVTKERDEAQGALETAGRHLKDYQGGGTPEDVIEACKELAAAYELISDIDTKGETEGADDISQVIEWLHSWLIEARKANSGKRKLQADLAAARKRVEEMADALGYYGSHLESCKLIHGVSRCTCGFTAALSTQPLEA